MEYPKIQTLFKRDENNKYVIIPDQYSEPIFEFIDRWFVSEKIDGTNVRIFYSYQMEGESLEFGGKTDNAQLPVFLFKKLMEIFDKEKLRKVFVSENNEGRLMPIRVILYGEGFGKGIQKGGNYIKDGVDFALFDVYVYAEDDRSIRGWWLERHNVLDVAEKLGIKMVPENVLVYTKFEIINYVKNKAKSMISENDDYIAEGIVARADPPILFRNGHPVMFKLKVKDFTQLKKFT